jgi:tRNA synthetases class I (E and Q), catalytic domain
MRKGKLEENAATLRLKMDMASPNPNMWDQIAYRVRYASHPHAGAAWCVYPTYDYTHCIVDSLEHIDYSICTLEFETRRESYYWLLQALSVYRPKVRAACVCALSCALLSAGHVRSRGAAGGGVLAACAQSLYAGAAAVVWRRACIDRAACSTGGGSHLDLRPCIVHCLSPSWRR